MATTADIRNGLCIKLNEKLFQVIEFQHVKPARGAAFVRTKLRGIESGRVIEHTFQGSAKLDSVRIEHRNYQYLYPEPDGYNFMQCDTYEQILVGKHMIENPEFLKEGMNAIILFDADNERPLVVELPDFIEAEVTYTEPGIKGDTATNTLKPATIDTGAEIRVPLFIEIGARIKVDTRTKTYAERLK
jgi:elongation factor P